MEDLADPPTVMEAAGARMLHLFDFHRAGHLSLRDQICQIGTAPMAKPVHLLGTDSFHLPLRSQRKTSARFVTANYPPAIYQTLNLFVSLTLLRASSLTAPMAAQRGGLNLVSRKLLLA